MSISMWVLMWCLGALIVAFCEMCYFAFRPNRYDYTVEDFFKNYFLGLLFWPIIIIIYILYGLLLLFPFLINRAKNVVIIKGRVE